MRRVTFLLLQEGQSGFSDPKTSFSKLSLQFSQQYSYIGMGVTPKVYKVSGRWCFVFGVWCLVFGVWCFVFRVW